jgi:hydroxymethylpyrimidine/phosphomethylpyrimidine kinase
MNVRKPTGLPVILTIAGYDPSSGAGITADIKTISAHKCYGVSCITALTVQSTRGVKRVEPVEGRIITETLEELVNDIDIAAIKIGMLGSAEAARAVVAFLRRNEVAHVVLDPVIMSSSGAELLAKDGIQIVKEKMLELTTVITPNIAEAGELTGMSVTVADQMKPAAAALHSLGARNAVITGGHLDPPVDLLSQDGRDPVFLIGTRIPSTSTHGTGCAYSTSLACHLASGKSLLEAARAAKNYVESAIRSAPGIGKGTGPLL